MARRIGRYEVERELKAGGMASAFLARAPDGRQVVLKSPLLADANVFARLRDEARVGARVSHPNLVETLDLFEHHGKPVLVVGYVRGIPIHDLRKSARVTAAGVARIGRQMASCLHALHEAADEHGKCFNVVHRDVSGGNILVDVGGDAHLIDLGIARFDDGRSAHTETGHVLGTIRYMAPDLFDGAPPTPATDLWALSCVLVECATGKPVFPGSTREVITRISRYQSTESLDLHDVDPRLIRIFGLVLQRDPAARIDTPAFEREMLALEAEERSGQQDLADLVTRQFAKRRSAPAPEAQAPGQFLETTEPLPEAEATQPSVAPVFLVAPPEQRFPTLAVASVVGLLLVGAFLATRLGRTVPPPAAQVVPAALVDGCGAPAVVEPLWVNADGTLQSGPDDTDPTAVQIRFVCPVEAVGVSVIGAKSRGHRAEVFDIDDVSRGTRLFASGRGGTDDTESCLFRMKTPIARLLLSTVADERVRYRIETVPASPLMNAPRVVAVPEPPSPPPASVATAPAVTVLDACGDPARIAPLLAQLDGTFAAPVGEDGAREVELLFSCPLRAAELTVYSNEEDAGSVEAFTRVGKTVARMRVPPLNGGSAVRVLQLKGGDAIARIVLTGPERGLVRYQLAVLRPQRRYSAEEAKFAIQQATAAFFKGDRRACAQTARDVLRSRPGDKDATRILGLCER